MAYVTDTNPDPVFTPRHDPIKPQMADVWSDVVGLGRDYVKLFRLKADTNTNIAKEAFGCFLVAIAFAPIGLAGLIFGGMGLLIADLPAVRQGSLVALAGGSACLALAVLAGLGFNKLFKTLVPKSPFAD